VTGDGPFTREQVDHAMWSAYRRGRADQRAEDRGAMADLLLDLLSARADVDVAWSRVGRRGRGQRMARELAEMRRLSRALWAAPPPGPGQRAGPGNGLGRPGYVYRGGAVDWETGGPAREVKT
jgi:hypothetical protein